MTIYKILKQLRLDKGLTPDDICERTGWSKPALKKFENGNKPGNIYNPTFPKLLALIKELDAFMWIIPNQIAQEKSSGYMICKSKNGVHMDQMYILAKEMVDCNKHLVKGCPEVHVLLNAMHNWMMKDIMNKTLTTYRAKVSSLRRVEWRKHNAHFEGKFYDGVLSEKFHVLDIVCKACSSTNFHAVPLAYKGFIEIQEKKGTRPDWDWDENKDELN